MQTVDFILHTLVRLNIGSGGLLVLHSIPVNSRDAVRRRIAVGAIRG